MSLYEGTTGLASHPLRRVGGREWGARSGGQSPPPHPVSLRQSLRRPVGHVKTSERDADRGLLGMWEALRPRGSKRPEVRRQGDGRPSGWLVVHGVHSQIFVLHPRRSGSAIVDGAHPVSGPPLTEWCWTPGQPPWAWSPFLCVQSAPLCIPDAVDGHRRYIGSSDGLVTGDDERHSRSC